MLRKSILSISIVVGLSAFAIACTMGRLSAEPIAPDSLDVPVPEAEKPPQELTDAAALFNKRNFRGAYEKLVEAVKKNPNLPPANIIMAQFYAQSNNPNGVRGSLERAVIDTPEDPQAYLVLGDIALRERRFAEGRLLFEKAAELLESWQGSKPRKDGMMPQLYSGLAAAAEARSDWDAAQQHLLKWLELDAKSALAMQRLAQCQFRQEKIDEALQSLQAAAKLEPEMLVPEAILAQWFARTGDQTAAKQWLVKALTAAPRDAKARLVAAQWAWETDQLDEAQKQADAALQLNPGNFSALILRGIISLFRKDYAGAEKFFESAHLQSPQDFAASNNLAIALIEQQDDQKRQRALAYAENNIKQYPNASDAYSTYGWVLYKLGRLQDAEAALRKAVSGGQFSAETAFYLANVLADSGHDADAIRLVQGALQTTGPFAQRAEAKALLQQLQASQPQQPRDSQPLPLPSETPPP